MNPIPEHFQSLRTVHFLYICTLALIFAACDPLQTILIENTTDSEATVTFVFNPGSYDYQFNDTADSDTLILKLAESGQGAVKDIQFGMGTWKTQGSLDSLIAAIQLISIETAESKQTIAGEEQLRTFFEGKISGNQKELIKIQIE